MAKIHSLSAEERKRSGSGALKQMRKEGLIPSVIYGKTSENINLKVNGREFSYLIEQSVSENILVNLEIKEKGQQLAFIQDIHHHPVNGKILHADFLAIDEKTEITAQLPIVLKGEPAGVKKGGLLNQQIHTLEIKCLPTHLPESLFANVDHLEIDEILSLKDIEFPEGVLCSAQPSLIIASVVKMKAVLSEEATEETTKEAGEASKDDLSKESADSLSEEKKSA